MITISTSNLLLREYAMSRELTVCSLTCWLYGTDKYFVVWITLLIIIQTQGMVSFSPVVLPWFLPDLKVSPIGRFLKNKPRLCISTIFMQHLAI